MWQRLGLGIRKLRGKATLQLKFSLSYILVIAAVLILLNSYPLLVSQNMMVASNQNNLKSTAKVIESAMIGLEKLTVENVQAALEGLDESGAARIMVTNSAGLVLYDTRQGSNAVGEYALYSVVAVALRGQDASYCSYDGTAFLSRVATPVVYHNQIVGAVYAYDYDTEQSELLEAFRHNLLIISLLIALLVAGLSIVLSQMLTRQISGLLQAIRKVREGAYSHRADASGTDEIAQIAAEFNSLTDRLQTTENARRRFVSDASHELKTPLAGIRLLTDSILQTDHMDEETTKEFVTDIGREAERLSRITENLLRLTRLDSGVVQQPYPVAVRPVLERVERMLTMVAQEKGVTISGAADEDAVALATDDDVHQILYNLMENAIKYSAAEDGFVRAEAHVDGDKVVLTVSDNGIGMDADELENNLGVIASSGTYQFRQGLDKEAEADVIGQFGVGFYSAFMVADHITVISRKYGQEQAYRWESDGLEGYTIEPCTRDAVGTDIIMHIKPDGDEEPDEYGQYLQEYALRRLVKKYSDYIRFPIKMMMPHSQVKEGSPQDKPEYEEVLAWETLNSMVPLWQRKKADVTREEYDKFYQERFGDPAAPLSVITVSAEGAVTYKALLYIPSQAPSQYYTEDYKPGLQLYASGVMIMDSCADLLPDYFNFVRGVVESPDLSLNISRELLQHDRQLKIISANLEKKIKAELERMLRDDREKYETFYRSFGRQLKLCALDNYGARKEQLQDLLLFYSSTEKKPVTLAEYVSRMQPEQKFIYFASGDTVDAIDHMPQTELLKDHNMEILYFTDKADEFLPDMLQKYQDKPFRSAIDGDLELGDEQKPDETDSHQESFAFLKEALGDKVDQVKASTRLKTHPVCLSSGQGITFEMEKYFTAVQPELGMKAKRILEINVDHPAFAAFETARITDPDQAKKYAQILYNQACLIAGLPIENPSAYTDLICSLWK